jgi:hypothetical protein
VALLNIAQDQIARRVVAHTNTLAVSAALLASFQTCVAARIQSTKETYGWMTNWVGAMALGLLLRALERSQIINDRADILMSYRGLVVVDHLVDFRCPSLSRQRWLV